ncbi:MAG TPA: hypothetical protein VGF14_01910 [Alphaproteobacteria bacterium]
MSKVSHTLLSFGLAMLTLTGCEKKMYDVHGNALKAKAVKTFFKTRQGVSGPEFSGAKIKKDSADYITAKGKVKKDSLRNAIYFRYTKGDTVLAGRAIRDAHQVLNLNDIDSIAHTYKDASGMTHRVIVYKGVTTEALLGDNEIPLFEKRKPGRMNDAVHPLATMLNVGDKYNIEPPSIDVTGDYKDVWNRYQESLRQQTGAVMPSFQVVRPFSF